MKLYLTRHGESLGNQQKIHQDAHTPLSDIGLSQAKKLAYRFKRIKIDIILSSSFKRAEQTAREVSKITKAKIETNPLFREYEWPPEIIGMSYSNPDAKKIRQKIMSNIDNKQWRYSTEESFFDLQKRVNKAKQFLENRPERNILLISHSFFSSIFISETVFKGAIHKPSKFIEYFRSIKTTNTGISVLSYDQEKPEFSEGAASLNGWYLQTFNDQSHLG